jgi:ABC-2 type transport system permease protein
MFFLSGAFYPVSEMPGWLQGATYINPLFYGVDALRHCFNGAAAADLPLALDLGILVGFTVVTTAVGVVLFKRME